MSAFRRTLIIATALTLPLVAQAQNRYETWSPTGTQQSQSANSADLLKDLKALVDEAEKARAADRMFLSDLRDLMARYERPWTDRVLFDDFQDGEFKTNPAWTLTSGEFWVEQGYGLRSKAVAGSSAASATEDRQMSKEELAISILGAVLQGANKNTQTQAQQPTPAVNAEAAVLSTRTHLSNAFAVNSTFSSWTDQGYFSFAVTQGTDGAGYRVVYTPKQNSRGAKLDLVRVTSRGQGVIDSLSIDTLEDKKNHTIDWTRTKDGTMAVLLDGQKRLSARDTTFRDPFSGVALINGGADVIVKSVEVMGMK